MHFNEFFNMCEKCLSDTLYETEGVIYRGYINNYKLDN